MQTPAVQASRSDVSLGEKHLILLQKNSNASWWNCNVTFAECTGHSVYTRKFMEAMVSSSFVNPKWVMSFWIIFVAASSFSFQLSISFNRGGNASLATTSLSFRDCISDVHFSSSSLSSAVRFSSSPALYREITPYTPGNSPKIVERKEGASIWRHLQQQQEERHKEDSKSFHSPASSSSSSVVWPLLESRRLFPGFRSAAREVK